jgi:hypothetical protein
MLDEWEWLSIQMAFDLQTRVSKRKIDEAAPNDAAMSRAAS